MSNGIEYTPDDDIQVHNEGAIKLICAAFQSHDKGLPEWAKNSADEYARRDAQPEERIIVLLFRDGKRGKPASIGCLDFSGMDSQIIEKHFRKWADPEASTRGDIVADVQGGHGNGGKCYMTQMFDEYSLLHTVKNGVGNKYGVGGGQIRFGYVPNVAEGRDFPVSDPVAELDKSLSNFGVTAKDLPPQAISSLSCAQGFTLLKGVGPKGYTAKIPVNHLVSALHEHPQMIRTMELCKVYVLANSSLLNGGGHLVLPEIEPLEGAEPLKIPIPARLKDPDSGVRVSTTKNDAFPPGFLTLHTSRTSMRWGKKYRHMVVFKATSGFVGYVPVTELGIQSAYRDRIYGDCELEALEEYKQNDRARLADAPLTRAVENFISHHIQKYAEQFEQRDKRDHNKKEKEEVSRINEALNKWKNKFLGDLMRGAWGDEGGSTSRSREPLPTGTPTRLELTMTHTKVGLGVSIRPRLLFFDEDGNQIRHVPFDWCSEDTNVAMVNDDLGVIETFSCGSAVIYAETREGSVRSNRVPLDVVHLRSIEVSPDEVEVAVGGRQGLRAICELGDGQKVDDVLLIWSEEDTRIARVSASGVVFGFSLGQTNVYALDDSVTSEQPATIRVVQGDSGGKGKNKGRGFPRIFVSSYDDDPDTGEPRHFGPDYPAVWQDAQDVDRNIWWINSSAPLAQMYLGDSSYGFESREWRMYTLERYVDIIVQIALVSDPNETGALSLAEWIQRQGIKVAEIQSAIALELAGFIAEGTLPETE